MKQILPQIKQIVKDTLEAFSENLAALASCPGDQIGLQANCFEVSTSFF